MGQKKITKQDIEKEFKELFKDKTKFKKLLETEMEDIFKDIPPFITDNGNGSFTIQVKGSPGERSIMALTNKAGVDLIEEVMRKELSKYNKDESEN